MAPEDPGAQARDLWSLKRIIATRFAHSRSHTAWHSCKCSVHIVDCSLVVMLQVHSCWPHRLVLHVLIACTIVVFELAFVLLVAAPVTRDSSKPLAPEVPLDLPCFLRGPSVSSMHMKQKLGDRWFSWMEMDPLHEVGDEGGLVSWTFLKDKILSEVKKEGLEVP